MSMPLSPTELFICTGCGATLPVDAEHAGRKCRCGRCGKIATVPGPNADEPELPPEQPKNVSFSCRVCETRLMARTADEGRKAKCPDCGALTVVPPPPKARPPQVPQAMHGQQYGLWDVDDAPLPAELAARQPKFFPVYCTVCDTLMHATARQVGAKLTCPDCGAKTVVKEPPAERPVESALVPDGEEYQLDEASAPGPRPVPAALKKLEAEKTPDKKETGEPSQRRRPKCPKVPLVQGVWPMLLRSPVPAWWMGLSVPLMLVAVLASQAFVSIEAGNPFVMVCSVAAACILGSLWISAAGALWLSILTESSEGNDRLYNPPSPVFLDWLLQATYLVIASAVAGIPGWAIGQVVPQAGLALAIGGWLVGFPVLLLSALEAGSPLAIFSPRLAASVFRRFGYWLLFYLESTLLIGAGGLAAGTLVFVSPWFALAAVPLCVGVAIVYFRLLGRLAWWLAESLTISEDDQGAEP